MKTSELIEELQESLEMNGDLEVMSSSNYGDYSETEQLNNIVKIETCIPYETAYSGTGISFPKNDEDMDLNSDKDEVLVLRYKY